MNGQCIVLYFRFSLVVLLCLVTASVCNALAGEPVGSVVASRGQITAIGHGERARPLKTKAPIKYFLPITV